MRAVVQRVSRARVDVSGDVVGEIGRGLAVLIGVTETDSSVDVEVLAAKLAGLRIFSDDNRAMNLSVQDVDGEVLVVSQFTLYGDARRGRRPSFTLAARPEIAEPLVAELVAALQERGLAVRTGTFGAHMALELINDGPVTILLETESGRLA